VSALPKGIRLFDGGNQLALWCPGCRGIHHVPIGGDGSYNGANRWGWDAATLTLSPSVKHSYGKRTGEEVVTCHYFVRGGQIEMLDDSTTHSLRGLHLLDEAPPENYGGREHFGWGEA
jgi:hypothetical protein